MTVHLRSTGELIASLPLLLGFEPRACVVLAGLTGDGTLSPVATVDHRDCLRPDPGGALARAIATQFALEGASRVVLVSYADGAPAGECAAMSAVAAVRDGLTDMIQVVDVWVVSRRRFRSPDCPDLDCCPDEGRELPEPPARVARAVEDARRARARGSESRARPSARRLAAVGAAYARCAARAGLASGTERESWRRERLDDWRAALALGAAGRLPSDACVARLAAGLADVVVRDAAVIDMVPGQAAVAEALCGNPAAPGVREALSAIIGAETAVAPDPGSLRALVRVADHVAWLAPDEGVPALTLAGLALWWQGDSVAAAYAVGAALAADPTYRLAELVACALEAQMAPGWLAAA